MYTQAVEFGAQIAKQTSKNGASVVEAGAQAGEEVRESVFASGLTGIVAQETAKEVRETLDKKDEGLLDKIGNFFAGGLLGIGAKFGESLRNN